MLDKVKTCNCLHLWITEDAYKGLEDQNQNKTPKCCRSITGRHQCLLCLATGPPTALAPTAMGLARP